MATTYRTATMVLLVAVLMYTMLLFPDVGLRWIRRQRPEDIQPRQAPNHGERQHALATSDVRLEQKDTQRSRNGRSPCA